MTSGRLHAVWVKRPPRRFLTHGLTARRASRSFTLGKVDGLGLTAALLRVPELLAPGRATLIAQCSPYPGVYQMGEV